MTLLCNVVVSYSVKQCHSHPPILCMPQHMMFFTERGRERKKGSKDKFYKLDSNPPPLAFHMLINKRG